MATVSAQAVQDCTNAPCAEVNTQGPVARPNKVSAVKTTTSPTQGNKGVTPPTLPTPIKPNYPSHVNRNKGVTPLTLPTPIRPNVLSHYLQGYDEEQKLYLVNGFISGFSLGVVGNVPPGVSPNHASALKHSQFIDEKLKKEISLNRIKGPYSSPPFANFKVSPLGVVPKKEPNSFRLIQDLSFGAPNSAVNHFIPFDNYTVSLELVR